MTLRTPRRRISPRTIRRYRAIKHFFRRALGSISQPEINTNSSRTDNVTDLKHKIIGLEQQLSEVSQHCRDIIDLESRRESQTRFPDEVVTDDELNNKRLRDVEFIYKTSDSPYRRSEIINNSSRTNNETNIIHEQNKSNKQKKSKEHSKHKDHDMAVHCQKFESKAPPATGSYSSSLLSDEYYTRKERQHRKRDKSPRKHRREPTNGDQTRANLENFERYFQQLPRKHKSRKNKTISELDQDFIADIIKRQYRLVKMFSRGESNLSQVSAPVCRDHELAMKPVQESGDLCSCCYGGRHRSRPPDTHNEYSDALSICDTRLYSSHKVPRSRHRAANEPIYDDCELYDLVPVKEKSSPKSRRKFVQDNMGYNYYKEVPPSPKTHRPRLNLKAQYYSETEDHSEFNGHSSKPSPQRYKNQMRNDSYVSDAQSEFILNGPTQRVRTAKLSKVCEEVDTSFYPESRGYKPQVHEEVGTSGLNYSESASHPSIVEFSLNKSQETNSSIDKTDKALCEIKDILQTFLQEIKKESSSHSGKSDVSTKITESNLNKFPQEPLNTPQTNQPPSLTTTSFNYAVPPCPVPPAPYMPPFTNPCCYPLLPIYPMMQNNCQIASSQSHTCPCVNQHTEKVQTNPPLSAQNTVNNIVSDTDELIKEIYKFVAQSPTFSRKQEDHGREQDLDEHKLTSRSVGGSTQFHRHDANVGTPDMKCYSKSCDAIGSRNVSESFCSTASYSETILENVSLEATGTTSDTDLTGAILKEKVRKNKLTNMLKSFSLFNKKKKVDVIEELSESDSAREHGNNPGPFGQNIINYSMYGQEYYKPPPAPMSHRYRSPDHSTLGKEYNPPYNPGMQEHGEHYHSPALPHHSSYYYPRQQPSAPPFAPFDHYNPLPQTPLCIKEVEVKSTGTQSEKKISFFKKFKKTVHVPTPRPAEITINNTTSTQTIKNKPGLFNWKHLQAKPMIETDPIAYSYDAQKKLAQGDEKIRQTLLKKMLYKKNPFSPSNLIVNTLLGRNKASYGGELPKMYRPKMFM